MLIAHISDCHIPRGRKKAYDVVPTAENLERCVAHINQLIPKPDVVLITGDITYSGLREEAERTADILEKLQYPFYLIPGNHDNRSTLWDIFSKGACPDRDNDFINYVVDGYDICLIGMDSTVPGAPGGEICGKRGRWLDRQLALTGDKPVIIFMHHPPAKFGVLETDEDGFIGADILGRVISKYDNIEALLCGHIHLAAHQKWQNTVITTAQSMGLQLVLDLTLDLPSQFNLEPPGYQLHYFTPENNLVSHTVTVKEVDGPYLF